MKIAFILPDLRAGGAEKVCINLAKDCVAEGRGMTKLNQLVEFSSQF